jgi:hypothetical protein
MFVFYSEGADAYWVMPSLDLVDEATRNKEGANAGRYSIVFTNTRRDGKPYPRPRFDAWRDNWEAFNVMAHSLSSARTHRMGGSVCVSPTREAKSEPY